MPLRSYDIRWSVVAVALVLFSMLLYAGLHRLELDSDITASLPQADPVIADARYIIQHHPIQDRVVIDVSHRSNDIDLLMEGGALIEKRLRESSLFKRVGLGEQQSAMPAMISSIVDHLPALFTERELKEQIEPLLAPENVRNTVRNNFLQLSNLESIGQAGLMAKDPLGFRNIALRRLSHLAPSREIRFDRGQMLSADGKHLLIIAEPLTSGTDTAFGRRVTALLEDIAKEMVRQYGSRDVFVLTPVGAYRAALDNELSAKRDTRQAVIFSTIAIAILLLLGFPRPLIGLLALLPALAGTIMALFVYSLFSRSISMLAVGFGGAIISFTVDYGIAYLLFLDRPYETRGMETTREVWSLGMLAMLTTAVSFLFLFTSGFSALAQLGAFAALGVVFTFSFVHLLYPVIFPTVPPSRREGFLPLQRIANAISSSGHIGKAYAALLFAVVMLFFAKPDFHVDLRAMNTVSEETRASEKLVGDVWGDVFSRIFLVLEDQSLVSLQKKTDRITSLLEKEAAEGRLSTFFSPSMLFPGDERATVNRKAWRAFWTPGRTTELQKALLESSRETGFAPSAFAPFFAMLKGEETGGMAIPEQFFGLLGISENVKRQRWSFFTTMTPGPSYRPEDFHATLAASSARIFDPAFFGDRLGAIIFSAFMKVALIVGVLTVLVALIYLLDWQLTLISMLPTIFALICTIGTLNIMGQPLGIPVIMVTVVVIGMGTDYALYLVRSQQRYLDEGHPSLGLIRLSVFLSFATTFLGFGVLALSGHALLKNAGLALALGIGYSYLGAIMIVPPLLKKVFRPVHFQAEAIIAGSKKHRKRTLSRYRHMEAYPRIRAFCTIMWDPALEQLSDFVKSPRIMIDVGCGYGITTAWLLELHPEAVVYGFDPNPRRVVFASRAIGSQGVMRVGRAPELPDIPGQGDTALMLNVIHRMSDGDLQQTLQRLHAMLGPEGSLIIRTRGPIPEEMGTWAKWKTGWRPMLPSETRHFRTTDFIRDMMSRSGFGVINVEPSASDPEGVWLIGKKVFAVHAGRMQEEAIR